MNLRTKENNMRKFVLVTSALFLFGIPAHAETRDLRGFDTVQASGRFTVDVAIGPEFQVRVEGRDAARIRTRVDDGALKIEPARRPWFGEPHYDATIHVTLPRLEGVAAARGAEVSAIAGGDCPDFSAVAAMGGQLRVSSLECDTVDAAAAMGGTVNLSGNCHTLDVSAAMGGDVDAAELHCRLVDASAAMGGAITAYADQSYDAAASMGGDINVAGGARVGDRSAAMGGSITQRP